MSPMLTREALTDYFSRAFTMTQATLLSEAITTAYSDLVKTSDFNELKEIVRDLGEAQKRTEQTLERLTQRMDALAAAQERTEKAQERTEKAQERTEKAQERTEKALLLLANGLTNTRSEVAGLARSFSYALENEAYRALPTFLRQYHNIVITRRFIRTYIGEQEINLLAEGEQAGEPVLIVGEAKAHLGTDDFVQLQENVRAVQHAQAAGELPPYRIVPLLIAHVARPAALRRAEREGVIVVQSFEW